MTRSLRLGSFSSNAHDDEVGRQVYRGPQNSVGHRPDLDHHLRLVPEFRFGRNTVSQSFFSQFYGKVRRISQHPFNYMSECEMRIMIMRERCRNLDPSPRTRREIGCANDALDPIPRACRDSRQVSINTR